MIVSQYHDPQILIKPYNFFNHCPSLAVSDAVTVKVKVEGGLEYDSFGTKTGETECYQKEEDFQQFTGDVDPV